ncbi:hypothetical protein [Paenibacillus camerounensis]|uniref:hypothetical protein n=1 Tax=Paenibacillus camerounensis TaxID=1243663 RepID=UPI0005A8A0C2|nr:hypothetical protein [Paenibacillus camerounensis]
MKVSFNRRLLRIFAAELEKLATLPTIRFNLMAAFMLNLVLAAAFTSAGLQGAAGTQAILNTGLASMEYLQTGFIVLGVLSACSEYTGGQIRTTLTVMPWRGLLLSAKLLVLALVTVPAAFIIAGSGILYSFFMMKETAAGIEIGTVISSLTGATGYLTLTTLLSAAISIVLRRSTPAMVVLLSYYFIVSPLTMGILPGISHYFPDRAGYYMYTPFTFAEADALTALQGTGLSLSWTLMFISAAIGLYRRRDA